MRCFYLLIIVNILILLCYFYQNNWSFSSGFFIRRAGLLYKDLDILNPISFGIYGGCLFLSCFCVLVKYKHLFPRLIINAAWFFLIIGLFNLIISTSRGPILSTILTTMVIAFITYSDSKKTFNFYNKILTILFIIFISGTLVLSYISVNNIEIGIFNRFKLMKENSQTGKKETRVDLYSEAFEMFKSSPIIGKRFVTESKYSGGAYPHNIFLEIMMALGLLGLFFFIIIMYNLYKKISSLRRESAYYLFFFCLLVFFFWMAQVTGSLFNNFELWILSATMFSLKNNCDFSEPLFSNKISHTIL
ncbi:MAG: O-antigen ligase family protein [Bacteroidales bacterium]|nr:O-antigen ligase family protein [Bacteroidales bacterium]